jgi:hypothetical protein
LRFAIDGELDASNVTVTVWLALSTTGGRDVLTGRNRPELESK